MKCILVTGFNGFVGGLLYDYFRSKGEVFGASQNCKPDSRHFQCDLSNFIAVKKLSEKIKPDLIIHAAGNKDILFCERNSSRAIEVNSIATANLVKVFGEKSTILYISTDYVFDGHRGEYCEEDIPLPKTQYGRSKLLGEIWGRNSGGDNFKTIRTSAIYSLESSFMKFLLRSLSNDKAVECFEDVVYSPTYYLDFLKAAEQISDFRGKRKVFHVCGEKITRYKFAYLFAKLFGFKPGLIKPSLNLGKEFFLFPDLSLNGKISQDELGVTTRSHEIALKMLSEVRM